MERKQERADPTWLAIAFFRACLYDLILCHTDLDEEVLRHWERLLRGGEVRDYSITRRFMSFVRAKRQVRNRQNVVAWLAYKLTHGQELAPEREPEPEPEPEPPAEAACATADLPGNPHPRCIACGGQINFPRRQALLERIAKGFRLDHLQDPLQCDELVNTHLTQAEMCRFVGHQVSFSYQEERLRRIYKEMAIAESERD